MNFVPWSNVHGIPAVEAFQKTEHVSNIRISLNLRFLRNMSPKLSTRYGDAIGNDAIGMAAWRIIVLFDLRPGSVPRRYFLSKFRLLSVSSVTASAEAYRVLVSAREKGLIGNRI